MNIFNVILVRKPFIMWILPHLCESNFCDDFNIIDETLSEMMYLVYIYNSFSFNLFLTF